MGLSLDIPSWSKSWAKEGCYKNYVRVMVKSLKCRKSRSQDSGVVQILHGYNETFVDYIAYSDEWYQDHYGKKPRHNKVVE